MLITGKASFLWEQSILKNYKYETEKILTRKVKKMETKNSFSDFSGVANKIIDKVIFASGTIALVWILAFLLVAMIDK